jgi:AraC family transcriptional activator of mtrCDE
VPFGSESVPIRPKDVNKAAGETLLLDKLLTALNVRIGAFEICEISHGWRLLFDPRDSATVHYAVMGSGVMRTSNGDAFPLEEDSFVMLPPRLEHSFGASGGVANVSRAPSASSDLDEVRRIRAGSGDVALVTACGSIRASYGGMLDLFDHLGEPIVHSFADTPLLRGRFRAIIDELSSPAPGTRALTESLLKQCLVLVLRRRSGERNLSLPWLAAVEDPYLGAALIAMMEHPAQAFTLESLAAIAGMSRSTFVRRFHAAFRKSPIDFLKDVRLRRAAHMLETTNLPVKAVATHVGYSSRSYFSRAFSELYGVDPSAFRARAQAVPRRTRMQDDGLGSAAEDRDTRSSMGRKPTRGRDESAPET